MSEITNSETMQIITGKTGENHVKAEDDRALHAGIFGTGNYVLNVGGKLEATIETANNISISDGELVMNGTHARIRYGENATVIVENGTTGYNRIDLIVARYTKKSGIEKVELAIIKGETTAGTPEEPEYTQGNILEGVEIAEMPLYAVRLTGVNVASVTSKFKIVTTHLDNVYQKSEIDSMKSSLQKSIDSANSDAQGAQEAVDSVKRSAQEAQQTADSANRAVEEAQQELKKLSSKMDNNSSKYQSCNTEISDISNKIANSSNVTTLAQNCAAFALSISNLLRNLQ